MSFHTEPEWYELLRSQPESRPAFPVPNDVSYTSAEMDEEVERAVGYGPAGQQTKEGAERAQAEYQIAQNTLALQVAHCRYCKAAKTRAANRLAELQKHDPEDINYVVRPGQGYTFGHLVEQQKHKVAEARCKEHAQRARLNYVCSPVSETYWTS